MIESVLDSPAQKCIIDGQIWKEGIVLNQTGREIEERERDKAIQQIYYVVRQPEKKLYALKYNSPLLPKVLNSTDLCHIYACPELGLQRIAMRRVTCHCQHPTMNLILPWKLNVDQQKQP